MEAREVKDRSMAVKMEDTGQSLLPGSALLQGAASSEEVFPASYNSCRTGRVMRFDSQLPKPH